MKKVPFGGHLRLSEGYKYLGTFILNPIFGHFKKSTTLHNLRYTRYEKSCNFVIIRPQKKQEIVFLVHFQLSEDYKNLRAPRVNYVLWSF